MSEQLSCEHVVYEPHLLGLRFVQAMSSNNLEHTDRTLKEDTPDPRWMTRRKMNVSISREPKRNSCIDTSRLDTNCCKERGGQTSVRHNQTWHDKDRLLLARSHGDCDTNSWVEMLELWKMAHPRSVYHRIGTLALSRPWKQWKKDSHS